MPWYFQYIPAATYLLTILTMNWIAITQKFSPALWDSRLNLKHQLIKGVKSTSERNKLLARLRFSLLLKEQMFIILIVAISVLWMRNQLDVETGFPLSIFLLFTTYLFFYYVRDASLKTYKLLLSRSPISQEVLDLPLIKDQSDNVNFWERLNNILRNRISLILTILIIVIQVLTVIVRGWDFIKMLWKVEEKKGHPFCLT